MTISIIVAVADNGVIGDQNRLIWHISEDLKRFKRLTTSHPVVMGRKTFESLGRPLPGRHNVVITRDKNLRIEGVSIVHSLGEAVRLLRDENPDHEIFIIGGGDIYRQSMPLADKLYITHVRTSPDGDATFPAIDPALWQVASREEHPASQQNPVGYEFVDYTRR